MRLKDCTRSPISSAAVHFHAVVQASARDFLRGLGQGRHRTSHQLRQKQRQPGGAEQDQHGEQQKKTHVGAAHQSLLAVEFEVAFLAGLKLTDRRREFLRKRHRDQNQAVVRHGCCAEDVFGWSPHERLGRRCRKAGRGAAFGRICSQGAGAWKLASGLPFNSAKANPPCKVVSCCSKSAVTSEKSWVAKARAVAGELAIEVASADAFCCA